MFSPQTNEAVVLEIVYSDGQQAKAILEAEEIFKFRLNVAVQEEDSSDAEPQIVEVLSTPRHEGMVTRRQSRLISASQV
jgi:hypothetical protein